MKILKILDSHDSGGVFTCECQYIEEMIVRGVTVDGVIIGNGDKQDEYKRILSSPFFISREYPYKKFRKLHSMLFARRYSAGLADRVLEMIPHDYKAIVYRRQYYMHLAGILGQKLNTPVYWFIANSINSKLSEWFYTWHIRRYHITPIANSKYTRDTLPKVCDHYAYPGYEENKITTQEPSFRKKLNIPQESPVFGIAARVSKEKAHDRIILAFKNSDAPAAGGHLLIAGGPLEGPWFKHLAQLAGKLLKDRIHFLGHVENMASFYSSIDILVNGRRDAEPFGISIAEAMAFGKPVIAYHLGGPSEMITNNETGWLVEKSQPEFYAEAFNKALQQKNNWQEMGKKASGRSVEFSCKHNVTRFLKVLNIEHAPSAVPGQKR